MLLWKCILVICQRSTISLSAHEGDKVFIPCLNALSGRIAAWSINGSLYPVLELPSKLYLQKLPYGILVDYTTRDAAGEFTCYMYNENKYLQSVSTVQFTVNKRDGTGMYPPVHACAFSYM